MLDKYKVFVRGSTETKKILGEIAQKRNIHVNNYEFSDKPRYQFGKCPIDEDSFMIWYTNEDNPSYFERCGYKEVTPQQFREIWLGKESLKQESKSKDFCCKGCEKLREVCQRLAKEGFVNSSSDNDFESTKEDYHFIKNKTIVHYISGASHGEIISPEEFYERIAGKPWEEKEKYLGFIGDSEVHIEFLLSKIKNPKRLFRSEDCFELEPETRETNSVQSFVKNSSENFLNLSKEKPLKIIL